MPVNKFVATPHVGSITPEKFIPNVSEDIAISTEDTIRAPSLAVWGFGLLGLHWRFWVRTCRW